MSELITNGQHIPEGLMTFARAVMTHSDVKNTITRHREVIDRVTPWQAMVVLDKLLAEGFSVGEVKAGVGKILNMFHRGLAVLRSCGLAVLRSCGLAVLRSCSLAVLQSCGLAVLQSCSLAVQ